MASCGIGGEDDAIVKQRGQGNTVGQCAGWEDAIIPLQPKRNDVTMQDTIITSSGDGPVRDHHSTMLQIFGVHVGRGCGFRSAVYKSIQGNGLGTKG